jgi:crossover junction endodeoxyribonuclease RuvC
MTYTRVVGIDPSLTGTGVAIVWQPSARDGVALTEHYGRKGKRNEDIPTRHARLEDIRRDVATWMTSVDRTLVVIEAPAHGAPGGSTWDRAGLWWMLTHTAIVRGLTVAEVSPKTRVKWSTGRGDADKATCAASMQRRYQVDADCDNCYDAAALALIGAHHLGWITAPQYATDALHAVTWPETLGDAA